MVEYLNALSNDVRAATIAEMSCVSCEETKASMVLPWLWRTAYSGFALLRVVAGDCVWMNMRTRQWINKAL